MDISVYLATSLPSRLASTMIQPRFGLKLFPQIQILSELIPIPRLAALALTYLFTMNQYYIPFFFSIMFLYFI